MEGLGHQLFQFTQRRSQNHFAAHRPLKQSALQIIPNQDPQENPAETPGKKEYYEALEQSIHKYNLVHEKDLCIFPCMMNVLMSILFQSDIPLSRLGDLQPLIYPADHKDSPGEVLAIRLPFETLEADYNKIAPETKGAHELTMWGLHGSAAANLGLIIRDGLQQFNPESEWGSGGCWCIGRWLSWSRNALDWDMAHWLEKFKTGTRNSCQVAAEVTFIGEQVESNNAIDVGPRKFAHVKGSGTKHNYYCFDESDSVITGLWFFNPKTMEDWPAELDFKEVDKGRVSFGPAK